MSRTQNGAEVILEILRSNGTDCIFASPIAVMAPLWEALAARREQGESEMPRYFQCSISYGGKSMSLKGGLTNSSSGVRVASFVCLSGAMNSKKIIGMGPKKRIALLAHDNKKLDLFEWAKFNRELLANHDLYATRTTGKILEELDLRLVKLESGPLGGDQQIGAKICEGEIDFVIFFSDPLEPLPHDPDIRALLRIAMVWNVPLACNRASADFMISSPLMEGRYQRLVPDYSVTLTTTNGSTE